MRFFGTRTNESITRLHQTYTLSLLYSPTYAVRVLSNRVRPLTTSVVAFHFVRSHTMFFFFFFFFFRLVPSGVATADFPSPVISINCIFLRHFNLSHVLFHHIHKPPFWPSPFPLSWQLHPQHPIKTNILPVRTCYVLCSRGMRRPISGMHQI